ncbi:uncharacterized protein V1510DRAFT_414140 [Dipodascopsis tothii]|uniref:uncharacterized protein n=1 Tax=Dipodascopsis tothii TaxID=44089 RepID=UPI0034CD0ACA
MISALHSVLGSLYFRELAVILDLRLCATRRPLRLYASCWRGGRPDGSLAEACSWRCTSHEPPAADAAMPPARGLSVAVHEPAAATAAMRDLPEAFLWRCTSLWRRRCLHAVCRRLVRDAARASGGLRRGRLCATAAICPAHAVILQSRRRSRHQPVSSGGYSVPWAEAAPAGLASSASPLETHRHSVPPAALRVCARAGTSGRAHRRQQGRIHLRASD